MKSRKHMCFLAFLLFMVFIAFMAMAAALPNSWLAWCSGSCGEGTPAGSRQHVSTHCHHWKHCIPKFKNRWTCETKTQQEAPSAEKNHQVLKHIVLSLLLPSGFHFFNHMFACYASAVVIYYPVASAVSLHILVSWLQGNVLSKSNNFPCHKTYTCFYSKRVLTEGGTAKPKVDNILLAMVWHLVSQ